MLSDRTTNSLLGRANISGSRAILGTDKPVPFFATLADSPKQTAGMHKFPCHNVNAYGLPRFKDADIPRYFAAYFEREMEPRGLPRGIERRVTKRDVNKNPGVKRKIDFL